MKKVLGILLIGMLALLTACGSGGEEATSSNEGKEKSEEVVKVGIVQLVEHPSLDAAREGFVKALNDAGYEDGKNLDLDYQNAQNDMNNNLSIAQNFVNDKKDLILAIGTSSTQAVLQATKDIPVLFTAITDPVGAGLVESFENPGGNVTGTSDTHPDAIKNTIKSITEFVPEAKKVGIVYNSGEPNAVTNVENAKKAMVELGLEPVERAVSTSAEVHEAANSLVEDIDVFYVAKDNTVVAGLESIIQLASEHDLPLFVGEGDSVKRGAFASWGFEYVDLGITTGNMGVEILQGKSPSEIPVQFPENLDLFINKTAAEQQGVTLTEEITKDAVVVE